MHYIVLDLETLGTKHDSEILEIGAVSICEDRLCLAFNAFIKLDQTIRIDRDTLSWWLTQGESLAKTLEKGILPLRDALIRFNEFLKNSHEYVLVGNGSTFDITILESAYERAGVENPTSFRQYRDLRTYEDAFELVTGRKASKKKAVHSAYEDAYLEAEELLEILKTLKKKPEDLSDKILQASS